MIHELRHYVPIEGRGRELLDRFQQKTLPLFRELGFDVVHFWHEEERPDHIWYLLSWPNEKAMKAGWQNLRESRKWKQIKAETEAEGPLIARIRTRTFTYPDR